MEKHYEISATVAMHPQAPNLTEQTLAIILMETGDIENVERITVRELET